MAQRLVGKIAVVTGGASGIGKATCIKFASEGASVVLVDLNKEGLNRVYESLTKEFGDKHVQACGDVADSKFAAEVFTNIKTKYNGPANVLVNCAGISVQENFLDSTEETNDEVIRINLKGVMVMTKAFLSTLKAPNGMKSASIVNISSIQGKSGLFNYSFYAASKAGVIGFTKTLGLELGKYGIRCNSILPGAIRTPMNAGMTEEDERKMNEKTPLNRFGEPEEVANACLFLASDESSYVTCANLEVTGGLLA